MAKRGQTAQRALALATEIGITSASVHYYFPTKGDLGTAVLAELVKQARNAWYRAESSISQQLIERRINQHTTPSAIC